MDAFKSIMTGLKQVANYIGNNEVSDDIQSKLDNLGGYVASLG